MVLPLTPNGYTAPTSTRVVVDLTDLTVDLGAIRTSLDSLADDLARAWRSTLATGNFGDIDRLLGASHAVHQAVVALRDDIVISRFRWTEHAHLVT